MALINLILFLLPFIFIDLSIFTHLYFLSFKNQFNINILKYYFLLHYHNI